eukprot:gene12763-7037_t
MKNITPLTFLDETEKEIHKKQQEYIKIQFLGSGKFGTVFLAKSIQNSQYFAIKSVKKEMNVNYEREMKILQKISNPYIITYVDSFHDEFNFNIVMEYIEGYDLNQIINLSIKFNETVLSYIIHQILLGLNYLHENHIIHRDLKTSNIMVDHRTGDVKIADFGTANISNSLDQFGTFTGTVGYMSPERLKGENHYYSSDIWSVGMIIMKILNGFVFKSEENIGFWKMVQITTNQQEIESSILELKVSKKLTNFLLGCLQVDMFSRKTSKELLLHPFIIDYVNRSKSTKDEFKIWLKEINKLKSKELQTTNKNIIP